MEKITKEIVNRIINYSDDEIREYLMDYISFPKKVSTIDIVSLSRFRDKPLMDELGLDFPASTESIYVSFNCDIYPRKIEVKIPISKLRDYRINKIL